MPADKIHVIPPGIGAGARGMATAPAAALRLSEPQPLATSPYRVLFVGSIFNRRHVIDLIRAFAPIARAHPDASLDIVGDNRSYPREDLRRTIAARELDGAGALARVRRATSSWRRSMPSARAFAFLSEYEGLGLTPLEALAAGVPPVLLDTPVARESCGDAALYVPPTICAATTRALESLLFDEAARARILAAAPARAREVQLAARRAGDAGGAGTADRR